MAGAAGQSNSQSSNSQQQPNGQRIEAIKQYYNQLCTNLRHIVSQLNAPEVTPQRRQVLLHQQEQVQKSLQEFTEKVLRPLANAAAANNIGNTPAASATAPSSRRPSVPTTQYGISPAPVAPQNKVSPPQMTPISVPPPPPMMFQNAPPPIRQALMAIQKQAQLIQQQQLLFQQKIMSRNFDSTLNIAQELKDSMLVQDAGKDARNFTLVSSVEEMKKAAGLRKTSIDNGVQGKTVSELVNNIDPKLECTPELEDSILKIADEFIDDVSIYAAKLALHRKDTKMVKKDFELAIDKLFGVMLPGSHRTTMLAKSVKKLTKKSTSGSTANPHHNRMAQLRKYFASQNNT